ncbi:MAG TPA: NAD(P)-dependent oxidoreductase [Thermoplasmata archaeon]|nr:NAD(P)-dependent oxidoreductase [Thermoplasmata archaeon]
MSTSAPPLVVIADPIAPGAVETLRSGPCRVVDASADPALLDHALGEAWGLIVRSRTKVTKEFLGRAPGLRFIARAGVGVDNIDVPAATARGIQVANAPAAATTSVAELTLAFLLLLARGLYPKIVEAKAGTWKRSDLGRELAGTTVGFVGYGRIAREVVRLLAPFGCTTLAFDPFVRATTDGTELLPLDDLLARSDFVSVHAASTPENRHLLDGARLARMKAGAGLINVARGALVDERALLAALDAGAIGGAALDVFEVEPPTDRALLAHPKVLATPHLGASTQEGQQRAGIQVVEETLRALAGKPLQGLVNPSGRLP